MTGHRDQWFGGHTYAQHGDDLAVLNIFKRLGIERPSYLDVGAYHPFDLSNTALLYERGSRGINVEPNKRLFNAISKARPEDTNVLAGVAPIHGEMTFYHVAADPGRFTFDVATATTLGITHTEEVIVYTLNNIVDIAGHGVWPDLLSIDIEGLDIDVLRSADFGTHPPRVVIVEADNGSGDTSHEMSALMHGKGFTLHSWAGSNMIFVRVADSWRAMTSIEHLRRVARQLRTFAPEKADAIDQALAEVDAGKRDLATINVGINFRLEKFDGEYQPGMTPADIIEGKG